MEASDREERENKGRFIYDRKRNQQEKKSTGLKEGGMFK